MEKIQIDRTDEERADLVKNVIRENWLSAVLVIGGAIAAVGGINYYKANKESASNQAALLTENVLTSSKSENLENAEKDLIKLRSDNGSSGYEMLATLSLAKAQFDKGEFNKSIENYDSIILNNSSSTLRDVAKIRKARVFVAKKEVKTALTTLEGLETQVYKTQGDLLSGDVLYSQGKYDEALSFYEKHLEGNEKKTFEQRVTLIKIKKHTAESIVVKTKTLGTDKTSVNSEVNKDLKEEKSKETNKP